MYPGVEEKDLETVSRTINELECIFDISAEDWVIKVGMVEGIDASVSAVTFGDSSSKGLTCFSRFRGSAASPASCGLMISCPWQLSVSTGSTFITESPKSWLLLKDLSDPILEDSPAIPATPNAAISWGSSGRDFLLLICRRFWNHICMPHLSTEC